MKEEHKLSVEINDISDNFGVYNFHLTKPLTFKEGSVFSELQDDAPLYPDKKDTTVYLYIEYRNSRRIVIQYV